jgi:hypothetical protein
MSGNAVALDSRTALTRTVKVVILRVSVVHREVAFILPLPLREKDQDETV